jgi:hypothetical protein
MSANEKLEIKFLGFSMTTWNPTVRTIIILVIVLTFILLLVKLGAL